MKLISSHDSKTFKLLKKLSTSSRERRKSGQTLLEGVHLIESALQSGMSLPLLAVSESAITHSEISPLLQTTSESRQICLTDRLFAEISTVATPVGIVALIDIPHFHPPMSADFALLLEDVQDPGNLGTLLRSAAAAGVQVVWLSLACADVWSPKVLRAAMGAHFFLALEERANLLEKASTFHGLTVATSLTATQSIFDLDLNGPVALIAGNEGAGLSKDLLAIANSQVCIPMQGQVESLNVATATSICLFERVRQKTKKFE